MNKTKKILTIIAISSMALAVALLIGTIFGLDTFSGTFFYLLLSLATISVACGFSISALSFYSKNKIIALVCLALLGVATVLGLITFWSGFTVSAVFGKITAIFAIATALFVIIVNLNIKCGERYKILQIITYALIVIVDIVLTLQIFGVDIFGISGLLEIFIAVCLVVFALLCALAILGKRTYNDINIKDKSITISKTEYEELLNKLKILEEENAMLKKNS